MPREKFGIVQALRGIAALWVVLFHASKTSYTNAWHLFDQGSNGVAIFFALSGFVIAHSIRGATVTPAYLGRFALRRSIRLDPAYWASIALTLAFLVAQNHVGSSPAAYPSLAALASNLTYTQDFLGLGSINVVYWTLCLEIQFYLFLILCVMAAQRFGWAVYLMPFAVAVAFAFIKNPVPGLFVGYWHCFFLGALAYWAKESRAAMFGFSLLFAATASLNSFAAISAFSALALLIAHRTGWICRGWAPLTALGTVSYSLYLTHVPVLAGALYVLQKLGAAPLAGMALATVAAITFATLFWWAVERPTHKLAKAIGRNSARVSSTDDALSPTPSYASA